jgi:hypothetical protein
MDSVKEMRDFRIWDSKDATDVRFYYYTTIKKYHFFTV